MPDTEREGYIIKSISPLDHQNNTADFHHPVNDIRIGGFPPRRWMQWARLPLQGVLAWLVWFSMGES